MAALADLLGAYEARERFILGIELHSENVTETEFGEELIAAAFEESLLLDIDEPGSGPGGFMPIDDPDELANWGLHKMGLRALWLDGTTLHFIRDYGCSHNIVA